MLNLVEFLHPAIIVYIATILAAIVNFVILSMLNKLQSFRRPEKALDWLDVLSMSLASAGVVTLYWVSLVQFVLI